MTNTALNDACRGELDEQWFAERRYAVLFASDTADETKVHYVPVSVQLDRSSILHVLEPESIPSNQHSSQQAQDNEQRRPQYTRLPKEIFANIAVHLKRKDIQAMRLVNKEWEAMVTSSLFQSVTMSFDEMSLHDSDCTSKSTHASTDSVDCICIKHGLNDLSLQIFRELGSQMFDFAVTFGVKEELLKAAQPKKFFELVDAYYGQYYWPIPDNSRYSHRPNVRLAACDADRLRTAFAQLTAMQTFHLNIENGLGWLEDNCRSLPGQIEGEDPAVIQNREHEKLLHQLAHVPDLQGWKYESEYQTACHSLPLSVREIVHSKNALDLPLKDWPRADKAQLKALIPASSLCYPTVGILYVSAAKNSNSYDIEQSMSDRESQPQKDWLIETAWAQRSFLDSTMMAIQDNSRIFHNLSSLKVDTMSSAYLDRFLTAQIWDAFPNIANLSFHVKPDWLQVSDGDELTISRCHPTTAVENFYKVLQKVSSQEHIKTLSIGWVGGGEHASGKDGRGCYILPAPVLILEDMAALSASYCVFPKVENLTLLNCWMTGHDLKSFIAGHANHSLRCLTLDSFSLFKTPRIFETVIPWSFTAPPSDTWIHTLITMPATLRITRLVSCGYVLIHHRDLCRALSLRTNPSLSQLPRHYWFHRELLQAPVRRFEEDKYLAVLKPQVAPEELIMLEMLNIWHGWSKMKGDGDASVISNGRKYFSWASVRDGRPPGGTGRISGEIAQQD